MRFDHDQCDHRLDRSISDHEVWYEDVTTRLDHDRDCDCCDRIVHHGKCERDLVDDRRDVHLHVRGSHDVHDDRHLDRSVRQTRITGQLFRGDGLDVDRTINRSDRRRTFVKFIWSGPSVTDFRDISGLDIIRNTTALTVTTDSSGFDDRGTRGTGETFE